MPVWEFNEADPSDVDVELTQRDQFNNDEVGLAEALVREAAQNSSDAPAREGQAVRLSFSFRTISGSELAEFRKRLAPLMPHLEACHATRTPRLWPATGFAFWPSRISTPAA